jgi:serine/threonine protein kinase/Tol biopolymer transport system component
VSIAPGARIGPYEVLSPLGAGGMGEVYRARDTTLGRDVALKVLPDEVVKDKDRVARFRREAQILATLNHPLIASIYGIDESSGAPALVLELVEGPTLAERLRASRLPLDDALAVAIQVAQALEAAHEQGIVHRDLKPANVKLRPDGTVKVLDFGLAKALAFAAGNAELNSAATETSPAMTRLGAIIGTAAYMSPEQARGHVVDRGADVWAFGAVLFEMLAGARAFPGNDTTETIASVLRAEPDWSRLPAGTPESVRRVLRRCLEKDRRRRLADVRDARLDLEEAHKGAPEPPGTAAKASFGRERLAWLAATVAALAAAAWPVLRGPSSIAAPRERHVELTTPPTSDPVSLAISPDGEKVAFLALADGRSLLWVHRLDTGSAQPLRGTDGATYPFWSPDSRSIGFVSGERLRRVGLDGDMPRILGVAVVSAGGTWNRDGVVLFPVVPDSPLWRMSDQGGPQRPLLGPETAPKVAARLPGQRFPQFLPDGRHFVYYEAELRRVVLGALDEPKRRPLFEADAAAVFAPPSELLFVRGGVLYSQVFDVSRLEVRGEAVSLAQGVAVTSLGAAAVSASAEGSIAYRTGLADEVRQLTWVDRSGRRLGTVGGVDTASILNPSLSPDGRRVALTRSVNGNSDVWIVDIERGIASRFTDEPSPDICPVWSPDGRSILYSKGTGGQRGFVLYLKSTATERAAAPLADDLRGPSIAMDWSHDGRFVMYRTKESPGASWDIWVVPTEGDRKPVAVAHEEFDERDAQFSPDDRWIAFESDKSGDFEIYVRPFPGPGASTRVSSAGGCQPRWRHDGTELFYVAPDGHLVAVPVKLPTSGNGIVLGTPRPLFSTRIRSTVQGGVVHEYDVSADGQRFLMNLPDERPPNPIELILDRRPASR